MGDNEILGWREMIKESFYNSMKSYHKWMLELVDGAEKKCPEAVPFGDCPNVRKKCPFKVKCGKGEYSCMIGALRVVLVDDWY